MFALSSCVPIFLSGLAICAIIRHIIKGKGDYMLGTLLQMLSGVFLFFALHIKNAGSFPPPLSHDEEKKLLKKLAEGDNEARGKLIEHNLRLVAHIIKKYYSTYAEQDDLISIGTIGLIKAINTYNGEKGARLATYAARCIENEILMYFRSQKKTSQDISMSEPIDTDSEGNPLTLIDIISTEDTIADKIDTKIKIEKLRKFVSEIQDEREKRIIIMRYGLDNNQPLTQKAVARKLHISRSYVSRIEKRALNRLRKRFGE